MDSTGKVGKRLTSLDNDAVYIKKSSEQSATVVNAKTLALKNALEGGTLGEDTVNLSISQEIQAAFGDDSANRAKKIADLKAKIEKGEYVVDTRVVAKELASEIAQSIYFDSDSKTKEDITLF